MQRCRVCGAWGLEPLPKEQYDIVDAVAKIATECNIDSTVALAWLKAQPGVQSTLIGARTLEQLEANLKALDVTLTPEQIASLDNVSRPTSKLSRRFPPAGSLHRTCWSDRQRCSQSHDAFRAEGRQFPMVSSPRRMELSAFRHGQNRLAFIRSHR